MSEEGQGAEWLEEPGKGKTGAGGMEQGCEWAGLQITGNTTKTPASAPGEMGSPQGVREADGAQLVLGDSSSLDAQTWYQGDHWCSRAGSAARYPSSCPSSLCPQTAEHPRHGAE